ncbi:hypothetical protein C8R43DRAFT_1141788 [Mycena crocata]|nr:hypothetical protein C8R43DRAFT_1141788 [Mycena crocata]
MASHLVQFKFEEWVNLGIEHGAGMLPYHAFKTAPIAPRIRFVEFELDWRRDVDILNYFARAKLSLIRRRHIHTRQLKSLKVEQLASTRSRLEGRDYGLWTTYNRLVYGTSHFVLNIVVASISFKPTENHALLVYGQCISSRDDFTCFAVCLIQVSAKLNVRWQVTTPPVLRQCSTFAWLKFDTIISTPYLQARWLQNERLSISAKIMQIRRSEIYQGHERFNALHNT